MTSIETDNLHSKHITLTGHVDQIAAKVETHASELQDLRSLMGNLRKAVEGMIQQKDTSNEKAPKQAEVCLDPIRTRSLVSSNISSHHEHSLQHSFSAAGQGSWTKTKWVDVEKKNAFFLPKTYLKSGGSITSAFIVDAPVLTRTTILTERHRGTVTAINQHDLEVTYKVDKGEIVQQIYDKSTLVDTPEIGETVEVRIRIIRYHDADRPLKVKQRGKRKHDLRGQGKYVTKGPIDF